MTFTSGYSVANVDVSQLVTGTCRVGDDGKQCAIAFETGPEPAGYTLWGLEVTINSKTGNPTGLSVAIHEGHEEDDHDDDDHGHDHGDEPPADPDDHPLVTLDTYDLNTHTAYCSATSAFPCELAPETTYFVVLSAPGSAAGSYYEWKLVGDDAQNVVPANNGWTLADVSRRNWGATVDQDSGWGPIPGFMSGVVKIWATRTEARLTPISAAPTSATLALAGHTGAWSVKRTAPTGGSCANVASGSTASARGLTAGTTYTFKAYSGSGCATANEIAEETFTHTSLAASSTGSASAAITLSGYTGDWSVKRIAPTISGCAAGASSGAAANVGGLTAGTTYTYRAYKASSCSVGFGFASGSVSFTHIPLTARSTGSATATLTLAGLSSGTNWWLKRTAPTTGTCTAGEADFSHALSNLTQGVTYAYTAYKASGCASANALDSVTFMQLQLIASDFTSTGATLALTNYTGAWSVKRTAPPGGTCADVASGATASASGLTVGSTYTFQAYSGSGCATANELDSVEFTYTPLAARSTGGTTATLTLSGLSSGANWWLKETSPNTGTCTAGEADFSHALSNLTAGTTYAYTAYKASGCADADALDSVSFTHIQLTAGDFTSTGATLTLSGHTGAWSVKRTAPTGGTCADVASGTTATLSSLTAGATYTFQAYSGSGCATANELISVSFQHAVLATGDFTSTGATLTLTGHAGAWSLKRTTPAGGSCANVSSGAGSASGLTAGATYTFQAYKASGCASADAISSVSFKHTPLVASDVTSTGATLTLSGLGPTDDWWYKQTAPTTTPPATCEDGDTSFEHDVSSLPYATSHTYTAYSDSGCTTALDSVSFTTRGFVVENTGETASSELCRAGDGGKKCAIAFTTGPRTDGYTLSTLDIAIGTTTGSPTGFSFLLPFGGGPTVAIHAANGDNPAASALFRIYLLEPLLPGLPLSGFCTIDAILAPGVTTCALAANTTYFLVMSDPDATAGNYYTWKLTSSNDQDVRPTGNGWAIADAGRADTGSGWGALTGNASDMSGLFSIWAKAAPSLSFGASTIDNQSYPKNTAISTLTLPEATASHDSPTITYTLSPALPAGLSFDADTRQITGTPSAAAASTQYTYTASAPGGATATLTFTLEVTAVPAKPARPTLVAGQGQIGATWTAPSAPGDDPITDYDVSYCGTGADDCDNPLNYIDWPHSGTTLRAAITGLDAGETYRVRVRAVNSAGAGEWSDYASAQVSDCPVGNVCIE